MEYGGSPEGVSGPEQNKLMIFENGWRFSPLLSNMQSNAKVTFHATTFETNLSFFESCSV